MSIRKRIRAALEGTHDPSPAAVAAVVLDALPDEELRPALAQALPYLVRDEIRKERMRSILGALPASLTVNAERRERESALLRTPVSGHPQGRDEAPCSSHVFWSARVASPQARRPRTSAAPEAMSGSLTRWNAPARSMFVRWLGMVSVKRSPRSLWVRVRMSPEERTTLQQLADEVGITVSEAMREGALLYLEEWSAWLRVSGGRHGRRRKGAQ